MKTKILIIFLILILYIIYNLYHKKTIENFESDNCPSPSCEDEEECPSPSCEDEEECPSPSCEDEEECPSPSCEDEEECPSPSCEDEEETITPTSKKEEECPAPSCDNKTEKVKTDFFISNLPSKELLKKTVDKIKDILGIKKEIKSEVKDEQIIFTITDMKIEDLNKNPETKNKLIKEVRDIFMDRLKKLGKTFKREQINIKFISGSVKVIVEILSLEEIEAKKKQSHREVVNRNYIQYKPMGKNGLFVPRTEIGDTTGELNKLFQDTSNIGGMTLN